MKTLHLNALLEALRLFVCRRRWRRIERTQEGAEHRALQDNACADRHGEAPVEPLDYYANEGRKDEGAHATAGHGDAGGDAAPLVKVLGDDDERGDIGAAGGDTANNAVGGHHHVDGAGEGGDHVHDGSDHRAAHHYHAAAELVGEAGHDRPAAEQEARVQRAKQVAGALRRVHVALDFVQDHAKCVHDTIQNETHELYEKRISF